jgi:hypothetical protein
MSKILKSIIFTGLILVGITTACNLPFISAAQNDTETPVPTVSLTGTATPAATPTASAPPASATPEFAPFCETGTVKVSPPAQCQLPIAEESSVFCAEKKPYNLIITNEGATYHVLTEGFSCSYNGMKDGRQMVVCTGPAALPFGVVICDPACAIPTAQAGIAQCPQGYLNVQGCCAQKIEQTQQDCVKLELRTIHCVMDCSVYASKTGCNKRPDACIWNNQTEQCMEKKK